MDNKIERFSNKFDEGNKNIESDNLSNADYVEFIAFLEKNKGYFKTVVLKYPASTRFLYLDALISERSDYELKNYIKNRSVKRYMFKNRFYTIYQYEILSLILSALLGFVFIGFFISFIPNIMAYMIASFLLPIVFYLFDVFEFIL